MKLLEKLKTMIYEEDEEDEKEEIAKKIDVEKTIKEEYKEYKEYEEENKTKEVKEEKPPIIFDVEDFIEEEKVEPVYEMPKKEEKVLYGGYEKNYSFDNYKEPEVKKEKFKPSLNISPVYGVISSEHEASNVTTKVPYERKSIDNLFIEEKPKKMDFDAIRQKAYGETKEDADSLLYEMTDKEEAPGIPKITLGDAEEYFEDLGLEYNKDYIDSSKTTRVEKNANLDQERKAIPVTDGQNSSTILIKDEKNENEVETSKDKEEKQDDSNLFDLIDSMYEE